MIRAMHGRVLCSGWWRGLWAALLMLGLLAPPAAVANPPDWLQGAICHAADAPGDHGPSQPATHDHAHCALCLAGHALATPAAVPSLPLPRLSRAEPARFAFRPWPGPGADRPYASRAPPRIG